ncbi:hypothetical protein M2375_001262 [Comamonas sp. BIGb0152]|nr:hypothetical protein [Comamonas sp. BIGb0152]
MLVFSWVGRYALPGGITVGAGRSQRQTPVSAQLPAAL